MGNWKAILNDPELKFDNRSPVDLKDRCVLLFMFLSGPLLVRAREPVLPLRFGGIA